MGYLLSFSTPVPCCFLLRFTERSAPCCDLFARRRALSFSPLRMFPTSCVRNAYQIMDGIMYELFRVCFFLPVSLAGKAARIFNCTSLFPSDYSASRQSRVTTVSTSYLTSDAHEWASRARGESRVVGECGPLASRGEWRRVA
jgi:hypothetical protein